MLKRSNTYNNDFLGTPAAVGGPSLPFKMGETLGEFKKLIFKKNTSYLDVIRHLLPISFNVNEKNGTCNL